MVYAAKVDGAWLNKTDPGGTATSNLIDKDDANRWEANQLDSHTRLTALEGAVHNVKASYGAVGNGSTNDRTAIQNALTAAGAAGGGIVYLPPGTYSVAQYLLIPSNVTLLGAGMGVSVIRSSGSTFRTAGGVAPDGGGYSMLQATGGSRVNIAVQDLTIDGNESADRVALSGSGVRLNSYLVDMRTVTGLRLLRVATRNTWTYSVMVLNCFDFEIAGCDVRDPGTSGVYDQLDGIHTLGSSRGSVHHCRVDNRNGTDADDCVAVHTISGSNAITDVNIHHNVLRPGTNGHGVQVAGDVVAIEHVTIADNHIYDGPRGIACQWFSGAGGAQNRAITIRGNHIHDITDRPIDVYVNGGGSYRDVKVIGNTIEGYGTNNTEGAISIAGGANSRGFVVADNTISGGYGLGIELLAESPVRDYQVRGNNIDMSAASVAPVGLRLASSLDGEVVGNTITGRGTADGQGVVLTSTVAATATNQILSANRVRAFNIGVQVTNSQGNNPTNTIFTSNNTQGNNSGTSFGTATVTQANNL